MAWAETGRPVPPSAPTPAALSGYVDVAVGTRGRLHDRMHTPRYRFTIPGDTEVRHRNNAARRCPLCAHATFASPSKVAQRIQSLEAVRMTSHTSSRATSSDRGLDEISSNLRLAFEFSGVSRRVRTRLPGHCALSAATERHGFWKTTSQKLRSPSPRVIASCWRYSGVDARQQAARRISHIPRPSTVGTGATNATAHNAGFSKIQKIFGSGCDRRHMGIFIRWANFHLGHNRDRKEFHNA